METTMTIMGLGLRDNGKENLNYYRVYWGNIGITEKNMETTKTGLGLRDNGKKMETTIMGVGFRVWG